MRYIDLTGKRFGRWLVLSRGENKNRNHSSWNCLCVCGTKKNVLGAILKNGHSKSCGCLNRDVARSRFIDYYKTHSSYCKKEFGVSTFNNLYSKYKKGANSRKLVFDLKTNDFKKLTGSNCYYCGQEPKTIEKSRHNNGDYIYNGIDRVDNTLGYVENNCVSCCELCNRMKHVLNKDVFITHVKKISNFQDNKSNKKMEII